MTIEPDSHLHIAIPGEVSSFNQIWRNIMGEGGYFAANNIYARLVILDVFETGDVYPDLADRWEVLDNGQRYIFHLNKNARWHDGVAVTSRDVVYTYRQVLDNGYFGCSRLEGIDRIQALDDHTVECVLHTPNAGFLAQLGSFVFSHILPEHLYGGSNWDTNPHNWQPVGNGPFKFHEWIKGERIELVANPDYWRDGPWVERITYHIVPDDDDAHAMLERGDVHQCFHTVAWSELERWRAKESIAVYEDRGNSLTFLAFNWGRACFQDRRVREAIACAIDRREFSRAIYPGLETLRSHYLDNITWAFNPDAVAPEKDLERARYLLDSAGFTEDAEGTRMRLGLNYISLYQYIGLAAGVLKKQLARIGIEVALNPMDAGDWLRRVQSERAFDLAIVAGDIGPDPDQMSAVLASNGARNVMGYGNPVVDECFRRGRETFDRDERGRHYKRLQAELAADIARVPLMRHGENWPSRTEFTGWSWSDGVRGTVPVWHLGKVRKSGAGQD